MTKRCTGLGTAEVAAWAFVPKLVADTYYLVVNSGRQDRLCACVCVSVCVCVCVLYTVRQGLLSARLLQPLHERD